jgi:hypothetical protein
MPTSLKAVLRTIGALDSILSILGLYLFLDPISRGLLTPDASGAEPPYFRAAFVTMIATNGVLLLLFVLAAVQLLRLKKSGVTAHTTASTLLVAYYLLIYRLGSAGGRAGMSVAAAIGIGNLGIAPFLCFNFAPYVYPIASTVPLLVARRKMVGLVKLSECCNQALSLIMKQSGRCLMDQMEPKSDCKSL